MHKNPSHGQQRDNENVGYGSTDHPKTGPRITYAIPLAQAVQCCLAAKDQRNERKCLKRVKIESKPVLAKHQYTRAEGQKAAATTEHEIRLDPFLPTWVAGTSMRGLSIGYSLRASSKRKGLGGPSCPTLQNRVIDSSAKRTARSNRWSGRQLNHIFEACRIGTEYFSLAWAWLQV